MTDHKAPPENQIKIGDTVTVITTEHGLQPRHTGLVVISLPGENGELWSFRMPDGSILTPDPHYDSFIRLEEKL